MEDKLLWIAKRLSDIAKDMNKLSEKEKQLVVQRAEKNSPIELIDLFNSLNEYGEL